MVRATRLLAALAAVPLTLTLASPAGAVVASPVTSAFGSSIDAAATWERESSCSQTEKKGPKTLRSLLAQTYGPVPSNILRACTAADSGHEEGRALDWMVNSRVPEQEELAESFLAWLAAPDEFGNPSAMARRLGIQYVIWANRMWRPADGQWTTYSDCDRRKKRKRAYDNACHRNHVHVSFSWDGALGRTSYYTGLVACPRPGFAVPAPGQSVPTGEPIGAEATRVLMTKRGVGLATGPCRVHPDVRLDFPVTGEGVVPASGVAAVTLTVRITKADAPAALRVWQAGAPLPVEVLATADRKLPANVTVTVPVGPEGLVSLQLTGGMANVTATVTGYAMAGLPVPPTEPLP